MNKFEKAIGFIIGHIEDTLWGMSICKKERKIGGIFSNYLSIMEYHFSIALIAMRGDLDDRVEPAMAQSMATIDEMIDQIDVWEATVADYDSMLWPIARVAAYLANHEIDFTFESPELADNEDLAILQRVVDALYDRPYKDGLDEMLFEFGKVKRQKLAFDTYKLYFELLECDPNSPEADALVAKGEEYYLKRAKDSYFKGGMMIEGGGLDNDEYVDYVLSAILKKIGWQGKSIHKWRWD